MQTMAMAHWPTYTFWGKKILQLLQIESTPGDKIILIPWVVAKGYSHHRQEQLPKAQAVVDIGKGVQQRDWALSIVAPYTEM